MLHTTRSDLVRRLLEDGLGAAEGASADITCADLMGDLIGGVIPLLMPDP